MSGTMTEFTGRHGELDRRDMKNMRRDGNFSRNDATFATEEGN